MFCWNLQSLFQASHVLGKSKGTDEAHLWGQAGSCMQNGGKEAEQVPQGPQPCPMPLVPSGALSCSSYHDYHSSPQNTHEACVTSWALAPCLTQGWKVLTKPTGVPLGGMWRTGFLPTLPQPGNHVNHGELLEAPSHLLGCMGAEARVGTHGTATWAPGQQPLRAAGEAAAGAAPNSHPKL